MANRSLLLISARPEDQAFAVEVAISAGLSLRTVADAREGAAILEEDSPSAILCDASTQALYSAFENAVQSTVGLFSDKVNSNSIYFVGSDGLPAVPYLIASPLFGHFIQRNYGDVKESGAHFGRIVRANLSERAFGLRQLLSDKAKIQVIRLQLTTQKQDAVEAVKNYLVAAKFQTRMATVVANAVDELLMNAMFDAPADDLGRPLFTTTARNASIKLEGRHAVEMHVGYDGTYVAITAVDQFGSLDKAKLLAHISKIYTEEHYKVRTSVASAGIGLARVFQTGGSFLFVSEARVRTEVTVFFRRSDNFREFKDQFRFLSTQFYF